MNAESPARGEASGVLADYTYPTSPAPVRAVPMALSHGTSEAAGAKQSTATRSAVMSAVVAIVASFGPISDEAIAERYEAWRFLHPEAPDVSESSLRTRRAEAARQGLVRDSGRRGTTKRGSACVLWAVVVDDMGGAR